MNQHLTAPLEEENTAIPSQPEVKTPAQLAQEAAAAARLARIKAAMKPSARERRRAASFR